MAEYIKQYAAECFIALILVGIFCVSFKPLLWFMINGGKALEAVIK